MNFYVQRENHSEKWRPPSDRPSAGHTAEKNMAAGNNCRSHVFSMYLALQPYGELLPVSLRCVEVGVGQMCIRDRYKRAGRKEDVSCKDV